MVNDMDDGLSKLSYGIRYCKSINELIKVRGKMREVMSKAKNRIHALESQAKVVKKDRLIQELDSLKIENTEEWIKQYLAFMICAVKGGFSPKKARKQVSEFFLRITEEREEDHVTEEEE